MGLMDVFNTLGGYAKTAAPLIALGTGVSGTIGNIQANRTRNQAVQQSMAMTEEQRALQNYYANLAKNAPAPAAMDPTQMAAAIASLQRPLQAGLVSGVGNMVQANMAERGLAQSPAIFSQVMAQALAPYVQNQQQQATSAFENERARATQQYMQTLGLPIQARAPLPNYTPYPEATSTAGSWAALLNLISKGATPGANPGMSRIPYPMPQGRYPGGGQPPTPTIANPPYNPGSEPGSDPGFNWSDVLNQFQNMQPTN